MVKNILSYLIIFTLITSLFSNIALAQDDKYDEQSSLNSKVQQELNKTMGQEQAEKFRIDVKYNQEQKKHKIQIENLTNNIITLKSDIIIDEDNNLEINIEYLDEFNNEVETTYEVLPVRYSAEELVADIIDKKTGEKFLVDTNEMNASIVPVVIAHIIRVGVSAAVGLVGRALIKAGVKKLAFRTQKLLDSHYDKHVVKQKEYGSISKQQYLEKAQDIIGSDSPNVISKKRLDGSRVFYNKETNDFVVLSKDGYIQTLFKPKDGIDYYNRQK